MKKKGKVEQGDQYIISFHPFTTEPSLALNSEDGQETMDGKILQVIQQKVEHASHLQHFRFRGFSSLSETRFVKDTGSKNTHPLLWEKDQITVNTTVSMMEAW